MRRGVVIALSAAWLVGCSTATTTRPTEFGTLAELEQRAADVEEIHIDDSLERAANSYRRYLEETSRSAMTPEAMRRLADLQIEQAYGVMGSGDIVEMAAPDAAAVPDQISSQTVAHETSRSAPVATESDEAFESRATQREELLTSDVPDDGLLPGQTAENTPSGPQEAIAMYWQILETYPNYERNDQVLYQLSRAYDEVGDPDKAMEVMDRFAAEYPYSDYLDEVYFRRGEYGSYANASWMPRSPTPRSSRWARRPITTSLRSISRVGRSINRKCTKTR